MQRCCENALVPPPLEEDAGVGATEEAKDVDVQSVHQETLRERHSPPAEAAPEGSRSALPCPVFEVKPMSVVGPRPTPHAIIRHFNPQRVDG